MGPNLRGHENNPQFTELLQRFCTDLARKQKQNKTWQRDDPISLKTLMSQIIPGKAVLKWHITWEKFAYNMVLSDLESIPIVRCKQKLIGGHCRWWLDIGGGCLSNALHASVKNGNSESSQACNRYTSLLFIFLSPQHGTTWVLEVRSSFYNTAEVH